MRISRLMGTSGKKNYVWKKYNTTTTRTWNEYSVTHDTSRDVYFWNLYDLVLTGEKSCLIYSSDATFSLASGNITYCKKEPSYHDTKDYYLYKYNGIYDWKYEISGYNIATKDSNGIFGDGFRDSSFSHYVIYSTASTDYVKSNSTLVKLADTGYDVNTGTFVPNEIWGLFVTDINVTGTSESLPHDARAYYTYVNYQYNYYGGAAMIIKIGNTGDIIRSAFYCIGASVSGIGRSSSKVKVPVESDIGKYSTDYTGVSHDPSALKDDGFESMYWTIFWKSKFYLTKTGKATSVSSTNIKEHPDNGSTVSYIEAIGSKTFTSDLKWYEKVKDEYSNSNNLVEYVMSDNPNAYPDGDDSNHKYWYVREN